MTPTFRQLLDDQKRGIPICSCGKQLRIADRSLGLRLIHGQDSHDIPNGFPAVEINRLIHRCVKRWHFWVSADGEREAARLDAVK